MFLKKVFLLVFITGMGIGFSKETLLQEENLFLRRIIEFCEEKEEDLAKRELYEYLKNNNKNYFFNYVYAFLGDIYLNEDNFEKAYENYSKIEDKAVKEKIFINYINVLFKLDKISDLLKDVKDFEEYINSRDKDIFYEISFLIGHAHLKEAMRSGDKNHAKQALDRFTYLFEEFHLEEIVEPMATALEILEDREKACSLYISLSEKKEERKEEFLFKAACLYSLFDKDKAIKIFSQIIHLGQNRANEAAFNKMILLMEEQRYADLLLLGEDFNKYLTEDMQKTYLFLRGKSHFFLKNYKRAVSFLKNFLENAEKKELAKVSLDMLIFSAERIHDEESLDFAQNKYEEFFPESEDIIDVYLTRALFHKKDKDFQKSKKMFDLIQQKFPNYDREDYRLEIADFYYQTKNYPLARLHYKYFIEKYKDHKEVAKCYRYFIDSSIKMLETVPLEKKDSAKNLLIRDLEEFLEIEENQELAVLLAQLRYELKYYDEALADFLILLEKYPKLQEDPKVNLLIAVCYQKNNHEKEFCDFSEKALFLDKDHVLDEYNIRSSLFNIYITNKEKEKAADHLFHMQKIDPEKPLLENIAWLIDFYFKKIKGIKDTALKTSICDRAIAVLENNPKLLMEDRLKLSDFYGYRGDVKKRKNFLKGIMGNVEKIEEKEKVFFDLGIVYKDLDLKDKSVEFFDRVKNLNRPTYYKYAAILYSSLIKIDQIAKEDFHLNNSILASCLKGLKNLKLQKHLPYEPLHLEAALVYVDVQYKIAKDPLKKVNLLLAEKEYFLSKEDIISKNYHHLKKDYPEKAKVLEGYLFLIDAEIFLCLKKKEDFEKAFKKVKEHNCFCPELEKRIGKLQKKCEKLL